MNYKLYIFSIFFTLILFSKCFSFPRLNQIVKKKYYAAFSDVYYNDQILQHQKQIKTMSIGEIKEEFDLRNCSDFIKKYAIFERKELEIQLARLRVKQAIQADYERGKKYLEKQKRLFLIQNEVNDIASNMNEIEIMRELRTLRVPFDNLRDLPYLVRTLAFARLKSNEESPPQHSNETNYMNMVSKFETIANVSMEYARTIIAPIMNYTDSKVLTGYEINAKDKIRNKKDIREYVTDANDYDSVDLDQIRKIIDEFNSFDDIIIWCKDQSYSYLTCLLRKLDCEVPEHASHKKLSKIFADEMMTRRNENSCLHPRSRMNIMDESSFSDIERPEISSMKRRFIGKKTSTRIPSISFQDTDVVNPADDLRVLSRTLMNSLSTIFKSGIADLIKQLTASCQQMLLGMAKWSTAKTKGIVPSHLLIWITAYCISFKKSWPTFFGLLILHRFVQVLIDSSVSRDSSQSPNIR